MSHRPPSLSPLFSELTRLEGIGNKTAQRLGAKGITRVRDMLFTLPRAGIEHRRSVQGAALPATITVEVLVGQHSTLRTQGGGKARHQVMVQDACMTFPIVFFNINRRYLQRCLPPGERRIVSGRVELFNGMVRMVNPREILRLHEGRSPPGFAPLYEGTEGVPQKSMQRASRAALKLLPNLEEWIDPAQKHAAGWPDWQEALRQAHNPKQAADLAATAPARERLAYDEIFAHQLTLALVRHKLRRRAGVRSIAEGKLQEQVRTALPFALTAAQRLCIAEITTDMAQPVRMNRLLQGDVGSGKTLVAFMALLVAVEAGGQGVLMVPTDVLAQQHLHALTPLADMAELRLDILTGRDKGAGRKAKLAALAAGKIDILLGTHAVFQADVQFADLRLAVVDEQHKFGVRQRLRLGQKGRAVDLLVMTATPIPRSLALAQYGDMDVSILNEKPPGRRPIRTAMTAMEHLTEVESRLEAAIARGAQAYWVCPLIEESAHLQLTAAQERFKRLCARLDANKVGLVHGRMMPHEKDAAMARFHQGEIQVLVATTAIEVGVDVPQATIMIIERAEMFGLAQLHQLRGRVGRGAAASACLLLYQNPLGAGGRRRLALLCATEDGFKIAQEDLAMRGLGDIIGTAQSGLPRFRIADLQEQAPLMEVAQSDARALLARDSDLTSRRGEAARVLLWLMEQDQALRMISAG
ncbi:MAG: ATP-dependent DNA helicase RecG [Rhodobacteraceae bacterium]|nr:ATP-dependent DNA helicase RecG [Paracoccaceae bacterium]